MRLGGTCRAAAAVTSGSAAQQHHHIARLRNAAEYVLFGRSAYYRADFHSLGGVTVVVNFRHLTCGKADLVAVGGIAGGGSCGNLALGQLVFHGL